MCTNTECGRASFDPLGEAYSLENILDATGSFSDVADRVAREALTWYAEWGKSKPDPVIFFRYEKGSDGWVANGQRMRDLFHSSSVGSDRKDRFVRAETGLQPGGQVIVISEDLGEGWNKGYIYVYTDRGDHIEGVAIEHRGSKESLMGVRAALSGRALNKETNGDKADFNQPLFFQEHIRPADVFFAVEHSYDTSERVNQQPYLARLQKAVENYPLLQTQFERNVAELAKRAEEQFFQSDVGVKLFSDVAQTLVQSLERDEQKGDNRVVQDFIDGGRESVLTSDNYVPSPTKEILMESEVINNTRRERSTDSVAPVDSPRRESPFITHHEPATEATKTVIHGAAVVAKESVATAVLAGEFVIKKLQERRKKIPEVLFVSERQATGKLSKEKFQDRIQKKNTRRDTSPRPFEKKRTVFASTIVLPTKTAIMRMAERTTRITEKKRRHRKVAIRLKETGGVVFEKQFKSQKERRGKLITAITEHFTLRKKRIKEAIPIIQKEKNIRKTRVEYVWTILRIFAKRIERQKKTTITKMKKFEKQKRYGIEIKQEKRKILGKTELMIRFSFACTLWLLFRMFDQKNHLVLKQTETLQGDSSREQTGEAFVKQEPTPWILLSIIWYLVMIREQGMTQVIGNPSGLRVNKQQVTRKKKPIKNLPAPYIPHEAVIFAFTPVPEHSSVRGFAIDAHIVIE